MKRFDVITGSTLTLVLLLAGCALTPPHTTSTPPPATSPQPTVELSVSPGPTKKSEKPKRLVLAGGGLGGLPIGSAQLEVSKILSKDLGKLSSVSKGRACDLDPSSPWTETLSFGDFWVQFNASDTKKSSPRTLAAWGFQLNSALPAPLVIEDDVPLDLTFAQLKAKYPQAKYLKLGLEDGTKALQLPNKLIFLGASKPEVVRAGEITLCE